MFIILEIDIFQYHKIHAITCASIRTPR